MTLVVTDLYIILKDVILLQRTLSLSCGRNMRKGVTELVGGAYSTIRFDGRLIGLGGETINRLRRYTGASIDLKPFIEPN